ncbi:hypothetical protein ACFL0Z_01530 [Patescibacteria group bacterium]
MVPGVTPNIPVTKEVAVNSLLEVAKWLSTADWSDQLSGSKLIQLKVVTGEIIKLSSCSEWSKTGTLLDFDISRIDCVVEIHLVQLKAKPGGCFFIHVFAETYIKVMIS